MKFETLKKDNRTKIAIAVIIICIIILVATFFTSHANLEITSNSVLIMDGTVNYTPYDFKILNLYKQKENLQCTEDNCYEEINKMPVASEGYIINETKSYCYVDYEEIHTPNIVLKTNEQGEHIISSLPIRSKCKIWFDKKS